MPTAYLGRGLLGVADVENATAISTLFPASSVKAIRTSGYAATGPGAGVYVSDTLATATLAANHPRFCKQSLDGRYWRLLSEASGFISVTQGGALGDDSTDDYAAIQATIDYAQVYGSATIYFPAGSYRVTATPEIVDGKGINLRGEGPDNTVISAGAFPAFKTTGYWRSIVEGLGFWCNGNTTGGAFQLDGHVGGQGEQGVTFQNCYFFGNYNSKYAFTNQLIAGGNGQGSENVWIGCGFAGTSNAADSAAFYNAGGNALQNTLLTCNFQSFVTGLKILSGNVDVLHCGFQSTYGYDQIVHDGWDVDASYSTQGDTITMTGCRTESLRIFKGGGSPAQITGFGYTVAAVGNWGAGTTYAADRIVGGLTAAGNLKVYRVTTAGTTGGSEPTWPESGTVADGSVVWTQLDYNVFQNVKGLIARGDISFGQIQTAGGINTSCELRDIGMLRDDAIVINYPDGGAGPLLTNCIVRNIFTGAVKPLKLNVWALLGIVPAAGTDKSLQFNIGGRTIVGSFRDATTGAGGRDMEISPAAGGYADEGSNYWGVRGGWGFAQVAFADLVSISREGVVFFVTDGTPGSSPLTGSGAGCLAVRQNGAWRAVSMGSGGAALSDGDYGDITVSGSGTAMVIDNGVVTLAKQADMATASVVYRKTAGAGAPEVQTLATLKTDLGLTGTNSGDQTITLTGDVTGSGTGSFAATIANNAVTLAKMATIATDSILGRATAATGDVEVLTALPFAYTGDVTRPADSNATTIANDAVTYAKMQNVSATDKLLGRSTAGSGDVEEIACTAAGRALLDDADAAAQRVTIGLSTAVIAFIIDGGGATITTGVKGDITIPFACTITEWTLLADQSGSIQIDIWKDTYANYPPTVADTITASAKPLFSTATKGQSSTLTGWTTSISAGDTLRFNVDSVTTCQRVTLSLKVTR